VKTSADSYDRISAALRHAAADVLFVSDVPAELAAARSAGCQVLLAERPGNRAVTAADLEAISSFDEIV
jgi:enolase-phosphatase E1